MEMNLRTWKAIEKKYFLFAVLRHGGGSTFSGESLKGDCNERFSFSKVIVMIHLQVLMMPR